jgi:hypothetical protein
LVVEAELTEPIRPLFGVNGVVCPKKEKREQKNTKKFLTRAGIVRDVRFPDEPGLTVKKAQGMMC